MAVEVTMPKFGLTMHEGTIQRFFKNVGERVTAGEPLYEVETEKVLYEVEAPASGTLVAVLFDEGATVECGVPVAIIAEADEDPEEIRARYANGAAATNAMPASSTMPSSSASAGPRGAGDAGAGGPPAARPFAPKLA